MLQILSKAEQEAEVLHPCQEEDRTLYHPRSTQASQCSIPGAKLLKLFSPSIEQPGNTKGGSITVQLTSCLTGLDLFVLQIKTKIVSSHTTDSKPVKQEANSTVILPPLVFPGTAYIRHLCR